VAGDEFQDRMLAGVAELLAQLDDLSFSQLIHLRDLDPAMVKKTQQELAKVRRALLKAQQVLSHLDLDVGVQEENES
jgi:hypothetical protein